MTASSGPRRLLFAHLGDLHITNARQQNFRDFLAIVAQIETECAAALDFVVLPGDNADNGRPEQYALVAAGLKMLSVPVHAITGDHDMEPGSLENFHAGLNAPALPYCERVEGHRCLFLDISGTGSGGPDFRLGEEQAGWLERELAEARSAGETPVVFMHTYPADLKGDGEPAALTALLSRHEVPLVDIGHTHYNELSSDGRTIFAATRSTGQIEEGPVGYSLACLDDGAVSWRFKPLDDPFPFVIITSPADRRLMRGPDQAVGTTAKVRATVLGRRALTQVECRAGDGPWLAMTQHDAPGAYEAVIDLAGFDEQKVVPISVRAIDETGRPGIARIEAATALFTPPSRTGDGSDADTLGAWPENGIPGTQLGPNRNSRKPHRW